MNKNSVLLITGSSRTNGNTEQLAEFTLKKIPHETIRLREQNL